MGLIFSVRVGLGFSCHREGFLRAHTLHDGLGCSPSVPSVGVDPNYGSSKSNQGGIQAEKVAQISIQCRLQGEIELQAGL